MRAFLTAVMTGACLAALPLAGASAQSVGSGLEVRVNPVSAGSETLLYPGGQYMRVVPHLREPGETAGPIHLHMPRPRPARARVATAPRPAERQAAAPRPAP